MVISLYLIIQGVVPWVTDRPDRMVGACCGTPRSRCWWNPVEQLDAHPAIPHLTRLAFDLVPAGVSLDPRHGANDPDMMGS